MSRHYRISGLGAGTVIALPQNQSLYQLNRAPGSISMVQVFSALQREQARIDSNEDPPSVGQYDQAGQMNVPGSIDAGTTTTGPLPQYSAPPSVVQAAMQTEGAPGVIYMPPQIVNAPASQPSFWRFVAPPAIAAAGLLAAVVLLTRKRKRR
jgi:hypothetical protein